MFKHLFKLNISVLEIESLTQDYIDDIDNNLPSTTVLLTTSGGSKVYVVGTVHFSLESQEEVAKVGFCS